MASTLDFSQDTIELDLFVFVAVYLGAVNFSRSRIHILRQRYLEVLSLIKATCDWEAILKQSFQEGPGHLGLLEDKATKTIPAG